MKFDRFDHQIFMAGEKHFLVGFESFEQDAYRRWSSRSINTYDNEIKSIEDQLNNLNLNEIIKLIDQVQYKIEKVLFSNKCIFFIETNTFEDLGYSFVLIINDAYIRTKSIDDEPCIIFTMKKIITWILKDKLKKTVNKNCNNVLRIDFAKLEHYNIQNHGVYLSENKIEVIQENTFNSFTNLKEIYFQDNKIKEIDSNLFKGLANLEHIDFSRNKIKVIHENAFNHLTKLNKLDFSNNNIKE